MDNKTTINLQYVIYKLKIFHVKNNKIINNKNYLQVIMIQTIISQINKSPKLHAIYEILHRALTSVQVTIKRLEIDRVKRIQYKKKILFQNKKFSAFRKKLLIDFFCKIMKIFKLNLSIKKIQIYVIYVKKKILRYQN